LAQQFAREHLGAETYDAKWRTLAGLPATAPAGLLVGPVATPLPAQPPEAEHSLELA
jgi:hypothetical protein